MKFCPKCHANIDGLVHHCDCCGAILDTRPHFFVWHSWEFPGDFSFLVTKMMDEVELIETTSYEDFLKNISFDFYCYPEALAVSENLKNRVYYSPARKFARITIVVDYNHFVSVEKKERTRLIAHAIMQGMYLLQMRLHKKQVGIDAMIACTEQILSKYL